VTHINDAPNEAIVEDGGNALNHAGLSMGERAAASRPIDILNARTRT
jgi:hypothetical protein